MNSIVRYIPYVIMAVIAAAVIRPSRLEGKPALKRIRLEEAVTMAQQRNRDYRIAVHRQRADKEKVNQAWGMLFPVLESEASLVRQGADSGFLSMTDGQYDIKVVQLKFGVNPGMFYHNLQISRKSYIVATEEMKKIQSEIECNIIQSYFNLILAEEMIKIRTDTIRLLAENLKDVTNLYKTGSVPRYDLLQAQVQLNSHEPLLLEAENQYRIALDMFNYQLGLDSEEYTADRSVIEKVNYRVAVEDMDSFVRRMGGIALKNRPEILQLKLKHEITGHVKNVNSSHYLWPTFSVGGYYGFNKALPNAADAYFPTTGGVGYMDFSQIAGSGKWQPDWQVRVAATYRWGSLIPLDSARSREREARELMLAAEEELSKIKSLITISIRSSYSSLVTSQKTIRSHRENVEKAREGLRIARESYRAGIIKNSELFGAQVALTQAQAGYISAVNSYYQSLAKLMKDAGVDDESVIFGGKELE
ncbi:MAG: TolC family protein [Chrysiogenales bacterium]|nr:MAG: TolC family protein [Chrysiogenales bacterium]